MIPVANQPILLYGLKHLARAGIHDVGIVLGTIHEGIREVVGDGSAFGVNVEYIHQGPPRGLADAVLCARDFLGQSPFVMYLGDNLLQEGVEQFIVAYEERKPDAVVGVTPVDHPERYGIVELEGSRIVSIEEKPRHPRSSLALIGVYLFSSRIHEVAARLKPSGRGELEITEAIWNLQTSGGHVVARHVDGWWKDTGRPEDLLEANERVLESFQDGELLLQGRVEPGARIEGRVGLGPGSTVETGSSVVGPSVVGAHVFVGRGSRIGPGVAVGDRVALHSAEISHSIVLEGTQIEGPIRVSDSLIGRNVEIRSGKTKPSDVSLILGDAARLRL